jgi:hypothetical protein
LDTELEEKNREMHHLYDDLKNHNELIVMEINDLREENAEIDEDYLHSQEHFDIVKK